MSPRSDLSYADAEELAVAAIHRAIVEDDLTFLDTSFADPAPDFIGIVGVVLKTLGYDPDEHTHEVEAAERRAGFTVVDGGASGDEG